MAPVRTALLLSALPSLASGHAFMTRPEMRGGAFNQPLNGYCPQCLGSSQLPLPTCGQSKFLDVAGPVTELRAGEMAEIVIRVTAHHKGHFVFRLCDRHLDGQSGGFGAEEACLNEHILRRARPEEVHSDCRPNDSRGDCQPYDEANPGYWYLPPPGDSEYRFHYWIPSDLTCESCTLQWWWMSANSCTPHRDAYACYFQEMSRKGWDAAAWWAGASASASCPAAQGPPRECGEQFKNCADVRVVGGSGTATPTPRPTAAPTASPVPTAAPPARPTVAPTQAPTAAPATTTAAAPRMSCDECSGMFPRHPCIWSSDICVPVAREYCGVIEGTTWCGGAAPSPAPPVSDPCTECAAQHPGAACLWPTGECYPVRQSVCASSQGTWCGGASLAESGRATRAKRPAFLGVALLQATAQELKQHAEL